MFIGSWVSGRVVDAYRIGRRRPRLAPHLAGAGGGRGVVLVLFALFFRAGEAEDRETEVARV